MFRCGSERISIVLWRFLLRSGFFQLLHFAEKANTKKEDGIDMLIEEAFSVISLARIF